LLGHLDVPLGAGEKFVEGDDLRLVKVTPVELK
jgi:hypothetical protein